MIFFSTTFVILHNVPEKKMAITIRECLFVLTCGATFVKKKWQRGFGNVYLYIKTCEATFVFVGHGHVEFQKSA